MLARITWTCTVASSLVIAGCSLDRVGIAGRDASSDPFDAGMSDAGPRPDGGRLCEVGGCDDENVCTNDVCNPAIGCVHTPVPGSCNDGVLCNGADSCQDGTCSVHDGVDPCPGASFCDAASDTCMGCENDSDCPGEMLGDWGMCEGATVCATTGTRRRSVTRYTCSPSGTCEATMDTVSEACPRATEGISCGAEVPGAWSACSYVDATCSVSGTRTRTVAVPLCVSGTCQMQPRSETDMAGCARTTEGTMCGTMTTPWSDCAFPDACGEMGTQSRTTTTLHCAGGTCSGSTTTPETQACTRNSDGLSCGTDSCLAWSPCVRATPSSPACTGMGVRTRRCTGPVCEDGVCLASQLRVEQESCMLGGGGRCERSRMCGACQPLVGDECRRGSVGYRQCEVDAGTCGMGGCGGGMVMDFHFYESCMCP